MPCRVVQTGKTWTCADCGRVYSAPPPDGDRVPPCGWTGQTVLHRGHLWHELWLGPEQRLWLCLRCRRQDRLPADLDVAEVQARLEAYGDCSAVEPIDVPRPRQAWSYLQAVTRWVLAGRPRRSQEEISRLLAICRRCPHYRLGRCALCGCRLGGGSPLTSKLAMATKHCPDGRW